MLKHIRGLLFVFICTTLAWIILGTSIGVRTDQQDKKLRGEVGQLWGSIQRQNAPIVYYQTTIERKTTAEKDKTTEKTIIETINNPLAIDRNDIKVALKLEHRKKGLLWYSTYKVAFTGRYVIVNTTGEDRDVFFEYTFPNASGVFDKFTFSINGEKTEELQPGSGKILQTLNLKPEESGTVEISYKTQGMDQWWYVFGQNVSQIKNFKLTMVTDFDDIDFPGNSISPTKKEKTDKGWELTWQYSSLITGIQIGMDLPKKLNPGPFVAKVTFFAPVSLYIFLFLMFVITKIRRINIHSMNYFFISCAFFSFHLLMAYLADHIDIHLAFIISSAVSIFLVISYMRLVAGIRFAFFETGLSQLIYLVLFSYTFFLEGHTGLVITICCILTLFVVMQLTGRIDWSKQFAATDKSG